MKVDQVMERIDTIIQCVNGLNVHERIALIEAQRLLKNMPENDQLKAENVALLKTADEYRDTNAMLVLSLCNPQWEYTLFRQQEVNNIRNQTVAELLSKQGDFGWELCGIDYGSFIMKRRKA